MQYEPANYISNIKTEFRNCKKGEILVKNQ